MKTLFGDDTVPDAVPIVEGKTDEKGDAEAESGTFLCLINTSNSTFCRAGCDNGLFCENFAQY